jgi:Tfp pilus assembly protein PilF
MKYIITAILGFFSLPGFSQQMNYQEWQVQAKTEIRLLPEYGNVKKSPGQIDADNELIKTSLLLDGTRRKASDHMVRLGFDYLYKGDLRTAMYRFNQAWLLDSKNENAYWGFGAIYFTFNDTEEALKQLEKGLLINPDNSNILTDKATIYMSVYMNKQDVAYLDKAIELFNRSYKIDPSNQNTLFKLSAAYFHKKDCPNARKYYEECVKLGGQPVPQGYLEALSKQCGN